MNERGSTTVENIIWLPFSLLLLGAIIQFGLYFNARVAVQTAAYEAARQAAIAAEPAQRATDVAYGFAEGVLPGWRVGERVSVAVESGHAPEPGDKLTVRVGYEVPSFLSGVLPKSSSGWLRISGVSSTTIEERP